MKKRVFIGAVCTLSSAFSYAQVQAVDETKPVETAAVEKISVVGAATNLSITAEEIEQYQANDLADIFRYSPSISVGGSVRFKTKDANDLLAKDGRFGGRVEASYFSNDGPRYSGSLYGKLSDTLGILNFLESK